MIRQDTAMPVSRFCVLLGIPCRSYFRRLARIRAGESLSRPRRAAPSTELCAPLVAAYAARWPELGHRRLHSALAADGHVTSPSTVLRALRLLRRAERRGPAGDSGESESRHTS
jgi:putative transposase